MQRLVVRLATARRRRRVRRLLRGGWAQRKGYSVFWFTILGFLFNIITAVVIAVLPDKYLKGTW